MSWHAGRSRRPWLEQDASAEEEANAPAPDFSQDPLLGDIWRGQQEAQVSTPPHAPVQQQEEEDAEVRNSQLGRLLDKIQVGAAPLLSAVAPISSALCFRQHVAMRMGCRRQGRLRRKHSAPHSSTGMLGMQCCADAGQGGGQRGQSCVRPNGGHSGVQLRNPRDGPCLHHRGA